MNALLGSRGAQGERKTRILRSLSIAWVVLLCCLSAMAQSDRGTITGTVLDPAGAVVPNAPVEAKNTATNAVYRIATSDTGNYTLSQLPVGTYEISVSAPGFKKAVRGGVEVASFTTFRVDFTLEVGSATESVTITADAPLLKTESGDLSHNVTMDRVDQLPLQTIGGNNSGAGNVRNPLAVIGLLPGAQFSNENTLRINGMPSSSQTIHVDGQDATNGFWRELNQSVQTGTEAIQEVAIQTSNFAAEYGQAGGGYINYTMRSGTNSYHGMAFEYAQNDFMNAGLPFTDAGLTNSLRNGEHIRNSIRRNEFGGNFGGPVRIPKVYNGENKTFFFFNYDQFISHTLTGNGLSTVPTLAYREGDFSTALNSQQLLVAGVPQVDANGTALFGNQIFDPASQTTVNGQVVRLPYAGNVIPKTSLDPTALKIQALLPLPSNSALTNNYIIPSYRNFTHIEIPSLKLDHNISSTIKVSFFYSANRQTSPSANGFTQVFTGAEPTDGLSQTTRINYDQSLTPTLLLHLGAGLLETSLHNLPPAFDSSTLFGSTGAFYAPQFPGITPGNDTAKGGSSVGMGAGFGAIVQKDTKPTFNANLTWVKGNHTFKFGGEAIFEGLPIQNTTRANGALGFAAAETADPYATGLTFSNGATGFSYASFLLGLESSLTVSPLAAARLGNHSFGAFAQDNWKVNRKLTLDLGLRWDYATLLSEQYGRMQNAAFNLPNPAAGGRNGTVIYGANCNCNFNNNYPFAFGPRIGIAYKLNDKTVLRVGGGISYGTSPNNAFLTYSVPDFFNFVDQPAAGLPAQQLKYGNPYAPGNPFGNAPLVYPDFRPHFPFTTAPGYTPPLSPFISIDRNAGRLPRITQWSAGIQREVSRGMVLDVSYVGNRGVWWTAPTLSTYAYNSLTPADVTRAGLNLNSATDLALLTTPISSPLVQARFPGLQVVTSPNGFKTVPSVYPGFPAAQTLQQALRPYPQFFGVPPFLGPPLGATWYDALQLKFTKRYSHGLDFQYAFTYSREFGLGVNSDTGYLTPNAPPINDVYNYAQNKQISAFERPLVSIISLNYQTPRIAGDGMGMKAISWVSRDWTLGAILRYQSGQLLPVSKSNNNFLNQLARGPSNNPAVWGGGSTYQNLVPGQQLLLVDPNCHCFDPTKQLVLNPKAWTDVGPGQFGNAPAYQEGYRWQRQPQESMSFGRIFPLAKEGKVTLQVRFEFQNIFNRVAYGTPTTTNPQALTFATNPFGNGQLGALSSGFGFVNTLGGAPFGSPENPRTGQFVARLQF
jgi:hypothetical protein